MEVHTATIEADTIEDPKKFRQSSVHHAVVKADEIKGPTKVRMSNDHHAGQIVAKGMSR